MCRFFRYLGVLVNVRLLLFVGALLVVASCASRETAALPSPQLPSSITSAEARLPTPVRSPSPILRLSPVPTEQQLPTLTAALSSTQTISLTIGTHSLQVELATTPEQRQQGLMFRSEFPENGGMLFVFPNDAQRSFWMRNTPLPLSIAFLDAEGRILNIRDMLPFDDHTHHPSAGPARYALEVHQGWFAKQGIKPGDVCTFSLPDTLIIE